MLLDIKNYRLSMFFFVIISVLSFSSCEKELNIDVDDAKKCLVMSSFLSPNEPFSLALTQSISYSETYNDDRLADASVSVFSEGVLIEDLVFDINKKKYIGSLVPVIGKEYSIEVDHDALPDLSAVTIMPSSPVINGIVVTSAEDIKLSFTIHDVEHEKSNFFRLLVRETWPSGAIKYPAIRSVDQLLRNKGEGDAAFSIDSDPKNLYSIFADKMFAGEEQKISLSFRHSDYSAVKPSVALVVQAITEDYYLFLKTHAAQRTTDYIPFSEPVCLHTNVVGGLGILASFSESQLTIL